MHLTLASFFVLLLRSLFAVDILIVVVSSLVVHCSFQLVLPIVNYLPAIKVNKRSISDGHNNNIQPTLLLTVSVEQLDVDVVEQLNVDADSIDPSLTITDAGCSDFNLSLSLSMRFLYIPYSSVMLLNPAHFMAIFVVVPDIERTIIFAAAVHRASGSYTDIIQQQPKL